MNRESMIGRGLRFLRCWQAAGLVEAKRRKKEYRDGQLIEQELREAASLPEKERRRQERAMFARKIRFRIVITDGEAPGEALLRSLREQTWKGFSIGGAPGTGEDDWVLFTEADGYLHPAALYECVRVVCDTGAEMVYTDEDYYEKTPGDRFCPRCKPDWGPDSQRGCNDAGPLLACPEALLKRSRAEDYARLNADGKWDAVLRMAGAAKRTAHIPKVLYYRRIAEGAKIPQPALRRVQDPITGDPLVSILIPNRDHGEDLKRCVDSIREKTSWKRWEIIIIENNSTEAETFRLYEELLKDRRIRVARREGSFNFSAVNNLGFREAHGEQIVLLNNDTEVLSPDWIQEMLMYTQREDVGAAGAKLYYPDGTIQHAGIGLGINIIAGHYHRGFPGDSSGYFGRLRYAQNVSAVIGACMMIPRHVYEELGGLDEGYSLVFNDIDFCLRVREKEYLIVWTPWAELVHHESKSRGADGETPEKQAFFVRETNRFLRQWSGVLAKGDPYYNPNLTREGEDLAVRGMHNS